MNCRYVSSFCGFSSCYLQVSTGDIVTDVFGNTLQTQSFDIQANYTDYAPFFFEGTVTIVPYTATQANFSITPPAERVEDVIGYQIYMFPLVVAFYDASCDYDRAYEFQYRDNITQWFFENPLNLNSFPPCINTSDYRCIFSNGENVILDIFPGYDFEIIIITIYPLIMFNSSESFNAASDYYFEALQFEIFTDNPFVLPTDPNDNEPTPIGNRVLLRWSVDPSFCDNHQLSIRYGPPNSNSESGINTYNSIISLDRLATCVDQYTYIYVSQFPTIIAPVVRINSSQIHVPIGSCIIVEVSTVQNFFVLVNSLVTDRPVIIFLQESFGSNNISLDWLTFQPEPGFVIDFYNIYSFPIFALKYNDGSCNDIRGTTATTEFSFKPTEYYRHSVSLSADFPFTCPPTPGTSMPYDCSSVVRDSNELFHDIPYDNTYAQGIVIETVVRHLETNMIEKVRSFPYTHNTFLLFGLEESISISPSFDWNPQLCQSDTSFIYFHYFLPFENEFAEINSIVSPCSDNVLVLNNLQANFFEYFANYISEVPTSSGVECLLSYESQLNSFAREETLNFPGIERFEYLDYETILISIFNGEDFATPATIYTIPFQALRLQIVESENNFCPSGSADIPPFFLQPILNTFISDMNNLLCENTSNYFCTNVSNNREHNT